MSINEFDKILNERFEEHEFAYNPKNWDQLSQHLNPPSPKRKLLPWLTGIAASLAILAGGYWFIQRPSQPSVVNHNQQETIPHQKQIAPTEREKSFDEQDTQPLNNKESLQSTIPTPSQSLHKKYVQVNPDKNKNPENTLAKKTPSQQAILFTPPPQHPVETPKNEIVKNTPAPAPQKAITNENLNDPIFFSATEDFVQDRKSASSRKTIINIAGGVNYGSLNTGYMAAINARKKIGKKLFIEGDIAFMQNQDVLAASMSTQQYSQVSNPGALARPVPVEEKTSSLYYLQMNPTIGYQIHEKISLGVGADIQKLLEGNANDRPVIATEQGFKLVPLWDAGITGKTEYKISNRIKAGLLYREGINNLLHSGDHQYFDRRYLQLQMKLRLFGK